MAGDRRRWWMLALGMAAQAASCVFLYGLPYLIPDLRHQLGLSLADASTLVAAPLLGLIVALVAWGAAADRYGERLVITAGLAIAGASLLAATQFSGAVSIGLLLVCAGVGTWPACCWSCRSSRPPASRWSTWSPAAGGAR